MNYSSPNPEISKLSAEQNAEKALKELMELMKKVLETSNSSRFVIYDKVAIHLNESVIE